MDTANMDTAGKRNRLDNLLARKQLAPFNQRRDDSCRSLYIEESLTPVETLPKSGAAKAAMLDSLLNNSPVAGMPARRAGSRKILADPQTLSKGWYEVGWPARRVYRVTELVQWWRILWRQKYGCDAPAYNWYLKKHLYQWLIADGYRRVEAVFEYAFSMWEVLQARYSIESHEPHIALVYAYRRSIYRDMMRTGSGRKTAIPVWRGGNDSDYSEQVVSL